MQMMEITDEKHTEKKADRRKQKAAIVPSGNLCPD
jgi:hypothetical protein